MSVSYDDLEYNYIDPTGNITILVESEVSQEEYINVSDYYFEKHPACEQVGFIFRDFPGADIRLQMAGGEFCGNATMSTGALYAEKTNLKIGETKNIKVKTSGAAEIVNVEISKLAESFYAGTVSMPCPVGFEYRDFSFDSKNYHLPVVEFQGMYHVIIEESMSKETAEAAVVKWCNELGCAGMGLMFLNEKEKALTPLVYVSAINTIYWEHSCASGTTATGYYLYKKYGKEINQMLKEPGGELGIHIINDNEIYLSGHVRFVDKGAVS